MEPFVKLDDVAVPLPIANIDTDQIIPARFLWRKRNDGWGHLLFHDLRFEADGRTPKPDFVLNKPSYANARIAVAARNFGCGSSREHAVWCLYDYGIRAVIAPSFGDIFANNSYQNGLLPVVLPEKAVAELLHLLEASPGMSIRVDLEAEAVVANGIEYEFDIEPFRKECLLAGTDHIGYTLAFAQSIEAFERGLGDTAPWV